MDCLEDTSESASGLGGGAGEQRVLLCLGGGSKSRRIKTRVEAGAALRWLGVGTLRL